MIEFHSLFKKITCALLLLAIKAPAQELDWSLNIGGNSVAGITYAYAMSTDSEENVYVSGTFEGTVDLDPGEGVYSVSSAQKSPDIFVVKLSAEGKFIWGKRIGGIFYENCLGIKTDVRGNVFLAGYFTNEVDFDPGKGTFVLKGDDYDIFVCKLSSSGNFEWAKKMGGSGTDICNSMQLDQDGNIYLSGYFTGSADFDPGEKQYLLTSKGAEDIFVSKLDPAGNLIWAERLGGASVDQAFTMTTDKNGNVCVGGNFYGATFFDQATPAQELTAAGKTDALVIMLNASGKLKWVKKIGGETDDVCRSLTIDPQNNVLVTGSIRSKTRIVSGKKKFDLYATPGVDAAFICKIDPAGQFKWVKTIGYVYKVDPAFITTDKKGNVYSTGTYSSATDFNPGKKADTLSSAGQGDVYICKLNGKGDFEWAGSVGGPGNDLGSLITVSDKGNIFVAGTFTGSIDTDPSPEVKKLTTQSYSSVFVQKLKIKKK